MEMKIIVVEPVGTGGMIHFAYQFCTALAKMGANVTLVTAREYELASLPHNFAIEQLMGLWTPVDLSSGGWANRTDVIAATARKIWRAARRVYRAGLLIKEWMRLSAYLIRQRPDVVQFGVIPFPFQAIFLAWLRHNGLTLTQICHEFQQREWRWRSMDAVNTRLSRAVFDQFSMLFFLSEQSRQLFLEIYNFPVARTQCIPHGNQSVFETVAVRTAGLRQGYGLKDDDRVVLFFGTLAPSKGVADLLAAFSLVRRRNPFAKLLVVGYPSKYTNFAEYPRRAEELGICDAVIFDPRYIPMREVGELIEISMVVAFPYRSATQSGALQVAYTFGRPVVVTDVGGLADVVENGRSGFLVPANSPEPLAEALLDIIDSPERARSMGAYARMLSQTKFAWEPIAAKVINAYRELLDPAASRENIHMPTAE
ncbi:MAG TPA: glycosyltransferase family 4 protein [Anaerolineales bacterium]|nr:glycosyltransferase family 4 protein [Anaerolineales bacterium]